MHQDEGLTVMIRLALNGLARVLMKEPAQMVQMLQIARARGRCPYFAQKRGYLALLAQVGKTSTRQGWRASAGNLGRE